MRKVGVPRAFSVKRAHQAQLRLSKQIVLKDRLPKRIRFVGGVDVAYSGNMSIGAASVLDFEELHLVESQTAIIRTYIPYIPTLLSFREIPPAVLCIRKLETQPDVILVDGHGFAHPYRCGFASHLGLVIGKSTIGVAKSKLLQDTEEIDSGGGAILVKHRGEIVGAIFNTKSGADPVHVSVGHMISLETAVNIVRHCIRSNRIPEPILKAHEIANEKKRKNHIQ
jgi:deoxyribonuclease V